MLRRLRLSVLALTLLLGLPALAQAGPPRSAIFFYPWYSNMRHDGGYTHWTQGGHQPPFDLASQFYPARGAYSSADPRVLSAQMRDIAAGGIDEVVSSWWGKGSSEDARLPAVIRTAKRLHLRVGVQLEPYPERTVESVGGDLAYLRSLGIRDVYVYRSNDFPADAWWPVTRVPSGMRLIAQTNRVGFAARAGFAGFYTYDILLYDGAKFGRLCEQARSLGILCAPSVGPGYEATAATGDTRVKPRLAGTTYDSMWRAADAAGADIVTITSYNEWHEGTQIEPASVEPTWEGYASYEGAWGRHGRAAENAYLWRTAMWSAIFRS